jgi:hypothetical protein
MSLSSENGPVLRELKKISKVLILANAVQIEKELEKIANSAARKKMWILIDGKRMPKDIAKEVGVSTMAASYFLDVASAAELVAYTQREPPRKVLDYVPPSWVALVISEDQEETKKSGDTQDLKSKAEQKTKAMQTDLSASFDKGEKKE